MRTAFCIGILSVLCVLPAAAQTSYPTKPIRLVVGYTPGGGTDLASRYVAGALSDLWGATVLVDNRPGAGGAVGTEITAKAAPKVPRVGPVLRRRDRVAI